MLKDTAAKMPTLFRIAYKCCRASSCSKHGSQQYLVPYPLLRAWRRAPTGVKEEKWTPDCMEMENRCYGPCLLVGKKKSGAHQ